MLPAQTQIIVGTKTLSETGNEVAPRRDYEQLAAAVQGEVQHWLPAPSALRGSHWQRMARSLLGNLRLALRLVRTIEPNSLVYTTGETWGLPVALAGSMWPHRPFNHVVYVHRVFSSNWLRFLRLAGRWLAVDGWICITQAQANLLRSALGKSARIAVVSQGVDNDFFDPAKASPAQRAGYLLSVGAEMRDYPLLFEAVDGLDIDVVVKASSTWMQGTRAGLGPIPSNIRVISERLSYVELRDLYAGARLVVVPLHETPQAAGITTILEGMAMGKCILATASTGLPDALRHDQTGWVTPASPQALRQAILLLQQTSDLRERLAQAGQRAARDHYTLNHYATAVAAFLNKIPHAESA